MNTSAFAQAGSILRWLPSSIPLLDLAGSVAARVVAQANPALEPVNPGQAHEAPGSAARHFSIRSFGLDLRDFQRTQLLELQWTRRLLPNRASLTPHFTAHSVMLLPEAQPEQQPASPLERPVSRLNFAPHSVQLVPTPTGELPVPLLADSIQRKRKLKMKKHKHRKRLKKMRQKNK